MGLFWQTSEITNWTQCRQWLCYLLSDITIAWVGTMEKLPKQSIATKITDNEGLHPAAGAAAETGEALQPSAIPTVIESQPGRKDGCLWM